MENKKPEFAIADRSVISIVTELHSYFRDLQSYYQIAKGEAASQLDGASDPAKLKELQDKLQVYNKKLQYLHVLNNSLSSADVLLHTPDMIDEFNSAR